MTLAGALLLMSGLMPLGQQQAHADELQALEQQIGALQTRLDVAETRVAPPAPSDQWFAVVSGNEGEASSGPIDEFTGTAPRGLTLLISPTADSGARHEVTVGGFVKANLIYDLDENLGDDFNIGAITPGAGDASHVRIHARHTRVQIKSRSDTPVGLVRTLIEGDFLGAGGNESFSNSSGFRVRHAWADWAMTPTLTFGTGQTWSNFMSPFALPPSVDVRGPTGRSFLRQGQVRLTYEDGPWLFAVAAENPETDIQSSAVAGGPAGATCNESSGANPCGAADRLPDFTARLVYETPQHHTFQVSTVVRELHVDADGAAAGFSGSDSTFGWGVLAAASFDLDIVTARVQATYGDGIGRYGSQQHGNRAAVLRDPAAMDLETVEAYSLLASLTADLTETSNITVAYGRVDFAEGDTLAGQNRSFQNVYVTWLWRPVRQMQLGAEVNWGERDILGGGRDDAVRLGFASWFYF